jgi:hypothetical protein
MLMHDGLEHLANLGNPASFAAAKNIALDNLFNRVTQFGIQEFYNESLTIFAAKLNWYSLKHETRNVASKTVRLEFKSHHIERIAELNRLDIEVYNNAKANFLTLLENLEEYESEFESGQILKLANYRINKSIHKLKRFGKRMFGEAA